MNNKLTKLKKIIKSYKKAAVAFSGGTDSTFLLKMCVLELGRNNVIAVTGSSDTYTSEELKFSKEITRDFGVKHIIVETGELEDENFSSNSADRCYYCKNHFYKSLAEISRSEKMPQILDGTNFDDENDYRPGRKASLEFGIQSPLLISGITKEEIREYSREMGLKSWDKPSNPCLASRLPYGSQITKEKLDMIAKAEEFIRNMDFKIIRVRHHDKIARLEISQEDIERFCSKEIREKVSNYLKDLGFLWVTLDIEGYKTGSLNAEITKK